MTSTPLIAWIDVSRRLTSNDFLERLSDLFIRVGVTTLFIESGSVWENGYAESFNGKLRDEMLAQELFDTLLEAKLMIERWRREYNMRRTHSLLGYRSPASEAIAPRSFGSAMPQRTIETGFETRPALTYIATSSSRTVWECSSLLYPNDGIAMSL